MSNTLVMQARVVLRNISTYEGVEEAIKQQLSQLEYDVDEVTVECLLSRPES